MTTRSDIKKNTPRYLDELNEFLRIPSISTDPAHEQDVKKAAGWLSDQFNALSASAITIHQTAGHPIVTAQFGDDPSKPTVLVYGHYDVQPAGDESLWSSPPFQPEVRDGKIYARGATDDKGQVFTYLKAVELMKEKGDLPCNIRFLIEGSEEVGSKNLPEFIDAHPELLDCDTAIISDTSIIAEDTPSITAGLRGHTRIKLTVKGPSKELHSGVFGGTIANPIEALSKMIATVTDEKGRVAVPGFYDDVRDYTTEERAQINQRGNIDQDVLKETGATALVGEEGYTTVERIGLRPAFTLLSIHAGPEPTNLKGVISPEATAMLAVRTVPNQDPEKIAQMMCGYLKAQAPKGVTVETEISGNSDAWALESFNDAAYLAAAGAYKKVWNKDPVPEYCGGSIPVVAMFKKAGVSTVMMGFGLESDNLHSPDEHISVNRFQKGIEALVNFFQDFPKERTKKSPGLSPT